MCGLVEQAIANMKKVGVVENWYGVASASTKKWCSDILSYSVNTLENFLRDSTYWMGLIIPLTMRLHLE